MKISAVAFLNSAPLWWGLRAGLHPEGWETAFDVPSACARRLAAGEADAGLIPSIEFARNPDLVLAAPLCVAARREVTSVLLLCGGDLKDLERVYLDPASRTSQALTKVLLERRLKTMPRLEEKARFPGRLGPREGALVIGDRALDLKGPLAACARHDLAAMWHDDTGLPFVFALWVARKEAASRELSEVLNASCSHGQAHLGDIEAEFSRTLGIDARRIHTYLTRHLHFTLGREEIEALALFFRLVLKEEFPHDRLRGPFGAP